MSDLFGGDSSPAPQPVAQQMSSTELPEWARGYGKDVLAKGAALTDISQNPYQAYKGQRIAGFDPLQQTAMSSVASPEAWGKNVQGYMSPYMQNVVEMQQRNAREQGGIQAAALNAKAGQMGAFGGSGVALQRAAQGRDLQRQLGDIQTTGLQTAFQQGTQQANTALGQQVQLGGMRQANVQQGLDTAYQDFMTQKNYPYQQLSYMSNLIRGTPMGMNNTSQVYQAGPTTAQQVAALGAGAYGVSKFMAEGGMAYADGGSVDAPDNVQRIVSKLSDQQLQQAAQAAQARGDMDQLEAIQSEMGMRASERNGIAGGVTNEMADRFAGGGILAFAARGTVDSGARSTDEELAAPMSDDDIDTRMMMDGEGSGTYRNNPQVGQIANALASYTPRQFTPSQLGELEKYYYQRNVKDAGPNVAAQGFQKSIEERTAAVPREFEQSKGLAALAAIPAILEPGGFARGAGRGAAKYAEGYSQALAAKRLSEERLAKAQFDLSDAQRKERMGFTKDAQAAVNSYVKNQQEGEKLRQLSQAKAGELLVNQDKARGLFAARTSGAGKLPQVDRETAALQDKLIDLKAAPDASPAQIKALEAKIDARMKIIAATKTSDKGPDVLSMEAQKLAAMTDKDIDAQVRKDKFMNADWQEAMGDTKAQAEVERRMRNEIVTRRNQATSSVNNNSGKITPIKIPD